MYLRVDGQSLFFDIVGEKLRIDGPRLVEKPTLISLHGGPGFDHQRLRPDMDALADIAQVLYLDHRGNGRSRPSDPGTWTLERWGDDVRALCDGLGIDRPVVFGNSFGGLVAMSYLVRHPGHAAGAILSSTGAWYDFDRIFAAFERRGGAQARAAAENFWRRQSTADEAEYHRVCTPLYGTRPASDPHQAGRTILNLDVARHFLRPGGGLQRMDLRRELAAVTCPVLVIAGREDPITPPEFSEEIVAHLPSARTELHVFDGCGHGPFRDDPDRVWSLVRRWIAGLSA
ncbi:MAG: alpha/beta fold hydrolase [Rubrivivax sp.]